ncbi:hypothetical protein Avbf_11397 [Armadillidium vulgare]|nr:hypothetical protein Avbf_11397 [Armadillidium vulgare]
MNEISNDVQATDFDFQYQSPTTRGTELSTFRCKHNHPSPSVVHEPFIKLNGLQQKLGYAGIKGADLHKAKNSTQTSENFCKKCDELDVENLSRDRHKKSVTNKFRKGEKESPNLEVINTYKET